MRWPTLVLVDLEARRRNAELENELAEVMSELEEALAEIIRLRLQLRRKGNADERAPTEP